MTAQDELTFDDMKYLNEQFGYGYDDEQIMEVIHTVGGYGADCITFDKVVFVRLVEFPQCTTRAC